MSHNTADQAVRGLSHDNPLPENILKGPYLRCPHGECGMPEMTHVVDVVWERDPQEGDRRWVRMEVRCELGHGSLLLIRNHGGRSYIEVRELGDLVSPFAEGARW
jgi:hypothetical protein